VAAGAATGAWATFCFFVFVGAARKETKQKKKGEKSAAVYNNKKDSSAGRWRMFQEKK
jgi:hypothetical protein